MSVELRLVPYGADVLALVADLALHDERSPDLRHVAVVLPHAQAAGDLRTALLAHARRAGLNALIPPFVGTLAQWLDAALPAYAATPSEREIIAWDTVRGSTTDADTWSLAHAALALFEALDAVGTSPEKDLADFTHRVAGAYGITRPLSPLSEEAQRVYDGWQAWRRQDRILRAATRARQWREAAARGGVCKLIVVGAFEIGSADRNGIRAVAADAAVTVVLPGNADTLDPAAARFLRTLALEPHPYDTPPSEYSHFLDRVYADPGEDLGARARAFASEHAQNPTAGRLTVLETRDPEREARAVDLAVRRAWHAGHRRIAVASNDHKLLRRARALLERSGILAADAGGWALSTTSAAAALNAWLDAVDHDFAPAQLMDLLRSPFLFPAFGLEARREAAAELETRVLARIPQLHGLDRYRDALSRFELANGPLLLDALERCMRGARAFDPLRRGAHRMSAYLEAVQASTREIGMAALYNEDAAGQQILGELEGMRAAAHGTRATFTEFRSWLIHRLERLRFMTKDTNSAVSLLSSREAVLRRFDTIVVAGASEDTLPAPASGQTFFNDAVRAELGLPTARAQRHLEFHAFRVLLEAAPRVVLLYSSHQRGEPMRASPWVERLGAFHRLAYGHAPEDTELAQTLALDIETTRTGRTRPQPAGPASAVVPAGGAPARVSASAHQALLDCPYQFFARYVLGLRVREALPDEFTKRDYGVYVHRILEAFHRGAKDLPGPWGGAMSEAEPLLQAIGDKVFEREVARDFVARAWLYAWRRAVPAYAGWLAARGPGWVVQATEDTQRLDTDAGRFEGRIDRIDKGPDGLAVIDYKTGEPPGADDVLSGEAVQLLWYVSLLQQPVSEAMYLRINEKLKPVMVAGAQLDTAAREVLARALSLHRRIRDGAPLPAHGDSKSCAKCDVEGLCRKPFWVDAGEAPREDRTSIRDAAT